MVISSKHHIYSSKLSFAKSWQSQAGAKEVFNLYVGK
jgi:hypothetical protein